MRRFFCTAFVVLISLAFCSGAFFGVKAEKEEKPSAVTVEKYDINIVIEENGKYKVNSEILVKYNEPRYGIDICIPYCENINIQDEDNSLKLKQRMRISDIDVSNSPFEVENGDGYKTVITGSATGEIVGRMRYKLSYTCTPVSDKTNKLDFVYYTLYPTVKDYPIEKSAVSVTFPKEIDLSKIRFFGGAFGEESTASMDYSVKDNTVTASLKEGLEGNESVVLFAELENGYFGKSGTDVFVGIVLGLLIAVPVAATFFMWVLYGRRKRGDISASSEVPDSVNAADVGYILTASTDKSDVVALMLYWATRGIIRIEELEKESFKLTFTKNVPYAAMKPYEQEIFRSLFGEKRETIISKDSSFCRNLDEHKRTIENYYRTNRIFTKESEKMSKICYALMLVPTFSCFTLGTYLNAATGAFKMAFIVPLLILVGSAVLTFFTHKKKSLARELYTAGMAVGGFFEAVALICCVASAPAYGINFWLAVSALISTAVCIFFLLRMRKRTRDSEHMLRQIKGLSRFVSGARSYELEKICEKDPDYFYKVLPYAYALGKLDRWAKQFERIRIMRPEWYIYEDGKTPPAFTSLLFLRTVKRFCNIILKPSSPKSRKTDNIIRK